MSCPAFSFRSYQPAAVSPSFPDQQHPRAVCCAQPAPLPQQPRLLAQLSRRRRTLFTLGNAGAARRPRSIYEYSPFGNESVISSLEILSLYWNSLSFRGGSVASLAIHCKRVVAWLAEMTGENDWEIKCELARAREFGIGLSTRRAVLTLASCTRPLDLLSC